MRDCKNCKHYIVDGDRAGCESWDCEFEDKREIVVESLEEMCDLMCDNIVRR